MPDFKLLIPFFIGLSVIVIIAGSILWLFQHPMVLILTAVGAGGLFYWLARVSAARNRV
jgi:hypothetical protein